MVCDFGTICCNMVNMVMVLGSFFVASLAECMVVSASFSL